MGMYDGIEKAQSFSDGQFIGAGRHRLEILEISERDGHKGLSFKALFKVVESDRYKAGDKLVWIKNLTKGREGRERALADVKNLVAIALGLPEVDVTGSHCADVAKPDQPLAGTQIDCYAFDKDISKDGQPEKLFTVTTFEAIEE